jgi:dimethylaniline monooxygenase (N-oxide forming)
MNYTRIKTVAIIGAGVAGLATARSLQATGLNCTVFERAPLLGGVWSDGYLNFGVQVQRELYEFPDWPLPEGTADFAPGPVIARYLADYADHFEITPHIRFDTEVIEIAPVDTASDEWRVVSRREGLQQTESFDLVVVCIGLYSNQPHIAEFPQREHFTGEVMHNSKLKSATQLTGKRVAVVGYGKSATDAVLEAATAAKEAHLIFRTPHWPIPQKLAGILPFKWGLMQRLNLTLVPPYQYTTPVERVVHSIGKPLVWVYWRMVEALLFFQCQLGSSFGKRVSLVSPKPIEIDAFGESTMIARPEFFRRLRNNEFRGHRASIDHYTEHGVQLSDGTALELDLVIMATGWETDFSFIANETWQALEPADDGFYLYRHILHPATPGLVFVGRVAAVSSVLAYCLQAHWLAQLIRGEVSAPSDEAMRLNIAQMKTWKRAWIPFSSSRSARLIAHTQHYHDELLRDFGVNPLRKRGWLAPLKEVFEPYQARDYADLFKPVDQVGSNAE